MASIHWVLLFSSVVLLCDFGFAQGPGHTYYNYDRETVRQRQRMKNKVRPQIIENAAILHMVNETEKDLEDLLDLNYTANAYDRNSEFIVGSTLKASMAVATRMVADWGGGTGVPYFPKSKQDYLWNVSSNTISLLWLQYMDANQIRTADRQQIYRIRRQILKAFSEDEKRSRELLLLTAAVLAAENADNMLLQLQNFEIIE
ncbi:MAG: hypothetical protein AAGB24_13980 [Bacteroidota bacterium]